MPHDFLAAAQALEPWMIERRRDFHRHPELGFQELRTAGIVAQELNALGLEVRTGIAKTGVVGLLEGDSPGPTVLLRFDMDALPVLEANQTDYVSTTPGVMHACGHDGHTTIGLATAKLLAAHRKEIAGTVKFVFQPAKEALGGAERMVKEGVNVIPPSATMLGTIRSFKPDVHELLLRRMSEMMQSIPGCYFFVGAANAERGLNYAHHNSRFDIDESALALAALMASAAARHGLP